MTRRERGQATVEFALLLPVLAVVLLVVLQLAVVLRDAVAVSGAARAAARRAMVEPGAARDAAVAETRLDPARMSVSVGGDTAPGGLVTVTVRYSAATDVPVVGRFVSDVVLTERLVALRE